MTRTTRRVGILIALAWSAALLPRAVVAQKMVHPPLATADIDAIARLEMMEDQRQFDSAELTRLLAAATPEVRRRAAITVARIADKRGTALLRARPLDADTSIAATTVFAVGQLKDPSTVAWFDSLLSAPRTSPTVAAEAAIALGKIKTAAARDVLARFLASAVASPRTSAAIGEALLSIGRATPRGDGASIVKWASSRDDTIRWSAIWALARLRDPAAMATLVLHAQDRSALIRSWAVRGLTWPQADSARLGVQAEALLLVAIADSDRTVRTEAIRALGTYSDASAVAVLVAALRSPDSWISTSAAEGLGRIKAPESVPPLVAATAAGQPCALRLTARTALQAIAPDAGTAALLSIARDPVLYCRTTAAAALRRLTNQTAEQAATIAALLADTVLIPPPPPRAAPVAPATRTLADYRAIVERWVVPDYNGAPRPTARWVTPRGAIDIELYPGDAPLAVEDFVHRIASGMIVGTQFTRVVPDFVDQQETIRGGVRIRDEVNRRGLTRANLAWATAGLDTGNPGYTLGHTPQPHNEGDFTSLGRVIRGMDAVDRIELGDKVTAARMLTTGGAH